MEGLHETDCWIQTYSGIRFFPGDPHPGDICIEDIAHALANLCRFCGQTERFYSVAQHAVLVSACVEEDFRRMYDAPCARDDVAYRERYETDRKRWAKTGLLHDAAEAYLGDVTRPLKTLVPCFREIEARLMECVREALGPFSENAASAVKEADNRLLATEARDLLAGGPIHGWAEAIGAEPMERVIAPLSPELAEAAFLKRWRGVSG